jgi:RsiW-degrading membrane proteinase PrsW (M82 family)
VERPYVIIASMSEVPPPAEGTSTGAHGLDSRRTRAYLIGGLVVLVIVIAASVLAVWAMLRNPTQTQTIRDVVIVFMAGEALIIGLALVLLIVQLARLTALLQNEIRPILSSTQETLNTVRGTTAFLGNNLVDPVIKANSSLAAVRRALNLLRPGRGK